jgi:endogenous inhibitor of DNA gyrase (YacG/DUF329 family)
MQRDHSQITVKCPSCAKRGAWFAGTHGPFCSHRCKLVDLGKWFGEEHAISEPLRPDHFESYGDLPSGHQLDEPEGGQGGGFLH